LPVVQQQRGSTSKEKKGGASPRGRKETSKRTRTLQLTSRRGELGEVPRTHGERRAGERKKTATGWERRTAKEI